MNGFSNEIRLCRIKPLANLVAAPTVAAKNKKYNIWTADIQEESLMENLKGCGVDREKSNYDRKSEQYDYTLKYRLNGDNSLKRRQSNNSEDDVFEGQSQNKRFRSNISGRKNVRLRLGHHSDSSSNESDVLRQPRVILDLNITADSTNDDVARDLANKLYEEKDDLMCELCDNTLSKKLCNFLFFFLYPTVRVVEVLGIDLPIQIFKETQLVESNGGMLIMVSGNDDFSKRSGIILLLLEWHASSNTGRCVFISIEE